MRGRCQHQAWGIAAFLVSMAVATVALGQAAQVTSDVGPHYVGAAISIRVTAVGFAEDPVPEIEVAPPPHGRLEFVGVSPSVSQSITIVNGRMSRTREVTHVFQYRFAPGRSGRLKLGLFRVHQGALETRVAAVQLAVQDVPSNDDVAVELTLPAGPVFVGERVPVTVTFTLESSLQQNVLGYDLRVPLFAEQSTFRFLDDDDAKGDTEVVIDTGTQRLELRGASREHREGGKRYTKVSVTRTLVPLAPGTHAIPSTSFSVEEGVRFRRDFFGGRRATQVRRWRAEDPGDRLEVAAVPGLKQPSSFGGAIGRGLILEVAADRTVVQVGDPITLTLVLHGEGLETASLPALDAEGLLPAESFRVPSESPTGEMLADSKRFTAVVRVLSDDVREIPALAYSWFDPDSRTYQTTRSRPIALSVRSAEVIGARDVQVGGGDLERTGDGNSGERRGDAGAGGSPRARSFALTGADLAIEQDPGRLLGAAGGWGARWLPGSLYAGSLLVVVLAVLDRRRRAVDPEQVRRRRLLAEEIAHVRGAGRLPPAEGAAQIARSLRAMLREVPEATGPEVDAVLGECDARSYAPAGVDAPLDAGFLARAAELAETIAETAR